MSQQITVGVIISIIAEMLKHEELANHAHSLLGPRRRGSTTDFGLLNLIQNPPLVLKKFEDEAVADGVRAYRLNLPNPFRGRLGSVHEDELFTELEGKDRTDKIKAEVMERDGVHGPERFLDRPIQDVELPEVTFLTFLIGEHEVECDKGEDGKPIAGTGRTIKAVFTWHPGNPIPVEKSVKLYNETFDEDHAEELAELKAQEEADLPEVADPVVEPASEEVQAST